MPIPYTADASARQGAKRVPAAGPRPWPSDALPQGLPGSRPQAWSPAPAGGRAGCAKSPGRGTCSTLSSADTYSTALPGSASAPPPSSAAGPASASAPSAVGAGSPGGASSDATCSSSVLCALPQQPVRSSGLGLGLGSPRQRGLQQQRNLQQQRALRTPAAAGQLGGRLRPAARARLHPKHTRGAGPHSVAARRSAPRTHCK
jgi:hypothetical protein